ncbi:hypothetical protein SBA3_2880013 [Candidatus Sulfopaludibacter sp. SbA3]|nr:hypothetical protein SBA3_2880013 [Candidatus Sulfopaludibacter sp. SbA3]
MASPGGMKNLVAEWDRRSFFVVCQLGRTAPQNGMKNRRLVAPAISPPVLVFRPPARGQRSV